MRLGGPARPSGWDVDARQGTAQQLHERSAALLGELGADGRGRLALVHEPEGPALVLGSTQPEAAADAEACARAGVALARRRSGGGAVLVEPGALIWTDLFVPASDPLWRADVGEAAWWLGEVWAEALVAVGVGPTAVWRGPLQRPAWSSLVCFAGLGSGEVTVGGRKMVGISQRRARTGALFQSACLLEWQPERLVPLLALDDDRRSRCLAETAAGAVGAGGGRAESLLGAFLAALPRAGRV